MCIHTYTHTHYGQGTWTLLHSRNKLSQQPWWRLQICRAGSQVWVHGTFSGCGTGHDRGLCQAPTAPSPALQEGREQLQTSGKLSSEALGAPWRQQLPGHPSRCSCARPDPETASLADKLQISLHHTAVLSAAENFSLFLMWVFFQTCAAVARMLTWPQCCGACVSTAGSWDGAGDQKAMSQGFALSLLHATGASLSTGQGKCSAAVMKQSLKNGFVPQWNYDSLDLLCRHPGSPPSRWIKWCWKAKSTKHQRKRSCSHGTRFALWPQKCCIRASLWRARQWCAAASLAAPQRGRPPQPNRASSSLRYETNMSQNDCEKSLST